MRKLTVLAATGIVLALSACNNAPAPTEEVMTEEAPAVET
jgi:protein involved in sex pheromone biosynthesis